MLRTMTANWDGKIEFQPAFDSVTPAKVKVECRFSGKPGKSAAIGMLISRHDKAPA